MLPDHWRKSYEVQKERITLLINRGSKITNESAVLTSTKIAQLIKELREEYDFVILDCPPVLVISDYIHISRLSDGVLYVTAYGITKKKEVQEGIRLLKNNNIKYRKDYGDYYGYK